MTEILLDVLPEATVSSRLAEEIEAADVPWTRSYDAYQSGGWWTCALLGRSSDPQDTEVCDLDVPHETSALAVLPSIQKVLHDLSLRFMTVRLARMDPRAALWEHRDYQDLSPTVRRRLHLILSTNPRAYLVTQGRRRHFAAGRLAILDPEAPHGACNRGNDPRIHLIMDAYVDERLDALCAGARECSSEQLPAASMEALRIEALRLRSQAGALSLRGDLPRWEQRVLQLYFDYGVAEGALYRVLEGVCRDNGEQQRAQFWAARRALVLAPTVMDDRDNIG